MWSLVPSFISRKRGRPDSDNLDLGEPSSKKPKTEVRNSRVYYPQPVNQRMIRRRFPDSPDRISRTMEKIRDKGDHIQRQNWFADFVPRGAVCYCYTKNLPFCNCKQLQVVPGTSPIRRLPEEILQEIFGWVVPPESFLDSSLHCGPNSAWCNAMVMKRSLACVSRQWYRIAIHLLYQDIVIRRMPQLTDIYDTLDSNPDLGGHIRSIRLTCFVPPHWAGAISPTLAHIFSHCPRLTAIHDLPPMVLPSRATLPPLPPTITCLLLNRHDDLGAVCDTISLYCHQLQELSIPARDTGAFDLVNRTFPNLHTLTLVLGCQTEEIPYSRNLQSFGTRWHMPGLKSLTFSHPVRLDATCILGLDYEHILSRHGRRLTYLAFPAHFPEHAVVADFAPLLARCPVLEHVVLPDRFHITPGATYESIRFLDHWTFDVYPPSADDLPKNARMPGLHPIRTFDFTPAAFPRLAHYRLLDTALLAHIPAPPLALDRRWLGPWSIAFRGLAVEQAPDLECATAARVVFGDVRAADDWDLGYFGAMETAVVQREQEYCDFGPGCVENWVNSDNFFGDRKEERDREERKERGEVLVVDRDIPRSDRGPELMCCTFRYEWLAEETDDEQDDSDLESENLEDLEWENEFYQNEWEIHDGYLYHKSEKPVWGRHVLGKKLPDWVPSLEPPAWSSVRDSFPWMSGALRDTLFSSVSREM
ncbi:hypothetical protein C8R43DRAFT_1126953 [Mycena crocata]|nr:hypothetical protein C8R43DRAFT_1126953 [Mycena crocata]